MNIQEQKLAGLSTASYSYSMCSLPSDDLYTALIVAFSGEAGNSHEHCGTFRFMDAVTMAGIIAWEPSALILDLRDLKYDWGDEMHRTLTVALAWYGEDFPTAAVVSDLNREGLTSLVEYEMQEDPAKWLFSSIGEAVKAIDTTLRPHIQEMQELRKKALDYANSPESRERRQRIIDTLGHDPQIPD
ncbi:MAG: hypothetical protein AAGC44_06475 [Planctomycetota bacterium]